MRFGGLLLLSLSVVLVQLEREDYKHLLLNLRAAILKAGLREKEVMYACGVSDPAQFSKMLSGQARLPLDVYAAMPEAVHQQMVIEEAERVGLPKHAEKAAMLLMTLHTTQERRRA